MSRNYGKLGIERITSFGPPVCVHRAVTIFVSLSISIVSADAGEEPSSLLLCALPLYSFKKYVKASNDCLKEKYSNDGILPSNVCRCLFPMPTISSIADSTNSWCTDVGTAACHQPGKLRRTFSNRLVMNPMAAALQCIDSRTTFHNNGIGSEI
jgi:hypothetical protein